MANLCSSDNGIYQGTVLLNNPCLWIPKNTALCCIDNVALNVATENLVDQKVGAAKCRKRRIDKTTVSLSFDIFWNLSADVISLALSNASVTSYDAGTPVTETITLSETSWASSDTENISYSIPYGNADGTIPTVVVTGSVDGVLTDGTDYQIDQEESCVGFSEKHNENFLTLLAHGGFTNNLTTDAQDIVITVTYTPATVTGIEFRAGTYPSPILDVTIIGVNKGDTTDKKIWKAKAYFLYNGNIFNWDNWESDLDAQNISLEIVEDSVVTGLNISDKGQCYEDCE